MSIQKFFKFCFFLFFLCISFSLAADDADYYYSKGQIQYKYQMYNYAVESLERALQACPNHYEAANLLAKIYLEQYKDRVRALQYFLQSLSAREQQPDIHFEVGKLYYFFNEYIKSKEYFEKALTYKQLVYAHYYLALIYVIQKDFQSAAIHREKCNELTIRDVSVEMEKGVRAKDGNNLNEAIIHFHKATQINPAHKEAFMQLALLYRMQKKIDKAIEALETCKKVYANDNDVLLTLAHLYFEYMHPKRRAYYIQQSIALCNEVISNDKSQCEAYSLLYEIYKRLNNVPMRDEHSLRYNECLAEKLNQTR